MHSDSDAACGAERDLPVRGDSDAACGAERDLPVRGQAWRRARSCRGGQPSGQARPGLPRRASAGLLARFWGGPRADNAARSRRGDVRCRAAASAPTRHGRGLFGEAFKSCMCADGRAMRTRVSGVDCRFRRLCLICTPRVSARQRESIILPILASGWDARSLTRLRGPRRRAVAACPDGPRPTQAAGPLSAAWMVARGLLQKALERARPKRSLTRLPCRRARADPERRRAPATSLRPDLGELSRKRWSPDRAAAPPVADARILLEAAIQGRC